MKHITLLTASLAVTAAAMTSCDGKSHLAKEVEGMWSGNPEQIAGNTAASSTMIRTFDFKVDDTGKGGTVVISALIDVQNTVSQSAGTVRPIEISAAASASATGSWHAADDDEIIIALDPKSAVINVDPDAIRLDYNVLDSESAPDMTALRPGASAIIGRQVNTAVTQYILSITKLDDIKVHDNTILECEIGDSDVTMRRQPTV